MGLGACAASSWWAHQEPARAAAGAAGHPESASAFGAVILFSFVLLVSPQTWIPALEPLRLAFSLGGFGVFALLWHRWMHGRSLLALTREMWIAGLLLAWTVVTLPLSYWAGGSMDVLTDLYIKALIVFWLLANAVSTVDRLRRLAAALMVMTLPLALTALKNFATGEFMAQGHPAIGRISGYKAALAENPNDLALMLNLLLPLGVALLLSARQATTRLLVGLLIALNVVAVVLTFSRAGFLALATIVVFYVVRLIRRPGSDRSWAALLLLAALAALPLLPATYVDRLSTIADVEADPTGSSQQRLQDTVAALEFIVGHPMVGAGLGNDILALNEIRGEKWKQVHNAYLQYAVDLGVVGLLLFLALFAAVVAAAREARRRAAGRPDDRELLLLTEGISVSLIVFAVAALFHPVAYHFYFYYIAGLALAARSIATPSIDPAAGASRREAS